jgi:hypothetical protein
MYKKRFFERIADAIKVARSEMGCHWELVSKAKDLSIRELLSTYSGQ